MVFCSKIIERAKNPCERLAFYLYNGTEISQTYSHGFFASKG